MSIYKKSEKFQKNAKPNEKALHFLYAFELKNSNIRIVFDPVTIFLNKTIFKETKIFRRIGKYYIRIGSEAEMLCLIRKSDRKHRTVLILHSM